ncbi:MAG TPA: hypothetical protein VNZ86_11665, partial [Bacteroidia bacterium]|nr:hypothetical protein [Bacteroidia bacterium]
MELRKSTPSFVPVLVFLTLSVLFYWQIGLMHDTLKWDALDAFLPWRRAVTESLRSGHLPFWNPYQYLGFPLHSDPECGAWYPVVWFIALFRNYDFMAQNMEFCFHIFLAGWGTWKLACSLGQDKAGAYLAGIGFMACGFFVGNAQNFIFLIGVAWFPLALYYLRKALLTNKTEAILQTALVVYMIISGSYPGCTIIALYALLAYGIYFFLTRRTSQTLWERICQTGLTGVGLLLAVLACSAVVLVSVYEAMPYFSRSGPIPYELVSENPFSIKGFVSFLFPYATAGFDTYNWGSAHVMLNAYIGLIPLVLIGDWLFSKGKNRGEWILFIAALLLLGMAMGATLPLRYWLYRFVPGMNLFRHPAIFRVFALLALLLLAGFRLSRIMEDKVYNLKRLKYLLGILMLFLVGMLVYVFPAHVGQVFRLFKEIVHHPEKAAEFSISNRIFIQAMIQIAWVLILLFVLYKLRNPFRILSCVALLDLFLAVQLNADATVNAATCTDSFTQRQTDLLKIAVPEIPYNNKLLSENEPIHLGIRVDGLWRNMNMLCKQPYYEGYNSFQFSATQNYELSHFFKTGMRNRLFYLSNRVFPFEQIEDSIQVPYRPDNVYDMEGGKDTYKPAAKLADGDTAQEMFIGYNEMKTSVKLREPALLTLLQNYHTNWKVFVDGKEETDRILRTNYC